MRLPTHALRRPLIALLDASPPTLYVLSHVARLMMRYSSGAVCILVLAILYQRAFTVSSSGNLASVYIRSSSTGCESGLRASLILELCFNATYDLIRRGVPDDIAAAHVGSVIRAFIKSAMDTGKNPDVDYLADLCVPVEKYSPLFTVRWTTVFTEEELDDMLMTIGNSFYSVANIDIALPALNATLEAERLNCWLDLQSEMNKPMKQIDYSKIGFPSSARHSFEWRQEHACAEWNRFSQCPNSTSAEQGLRKVLKMATDLISMGADPAGTWQIVRHYTALVHLGIRCLKTDGTALQVPNCFTQTYGHAAIKLLKKAKNDGTLATKKDIPEEAFEAVFKFEYKRMSTFGSWGQPDAHFGAGLTIKNMLAYTSAATFTTLKFAALFFSFNSSNLFSSSRTMTAPDCQSPLNTNGNQVCETEDSYCFYPATWTVSSWLENCCNELICNNVVALIPEYFDSYDDCCKSCHQLDCEPSFLQNDTLNVPQTSGEQNMTVNVYL